MSVAVIRTLKKANGGGAQITYYDNTTVLGYDYVASGQDVLHPSITMPTKSGKTFVGWSTTTSENNWVGSLTANGQPMNLYAIYVDSTKTLTVDNVWLSGTISGNARAYWGSSSGTYQFKLLKKGRYATANCTLYINADGSGGLVTGYVQLDSGAQIQVTEGGSNSGTYSNISTGTHTVTVSSTSYGEWWELVTSSASITLTNPIAWT